MYEVPFGLLAKQCLALLRTNVSEAQATEPFNRTFGDVSDVSYVFSFR